jgi:hypothetical protein
LQKQEPVFNYTFFRGTKDQLLGGKYTIIVVHYKCIRVLIITTTIESFVAPTDMVYKVTVKQDKKEDIILECPGR